ncbi:MAG: 50S ribosomal protein L21 [Candidatus Woesebacteria bacterium GW2011_GWF1_40_24]|uniref:Large ribosomal subunit protein bL21 n=7 Tax=Candidatus Woeseibacteriota TaxID=1752722 RepID=A0A0G0UWM9_9BACT|nr:MAG: 50S ribosomal protein L21 [Candidatus Woesebacteria bacterium GW2011_GWF1_40_24]
MFLPTFSVKIHIIVMKSKGIQKYAVVRIGGKQYRVAEGEEILVDKLEDPKKISTEVLLFTDGEKVSVGKPTLKTEVKLKVLSELEKGEKVEIYKFKAKSRYKRHTGFRAQYTRLLVEKIG